MKAQEESNFARIAEAISYITANFKTQPGFEEVAGKIPDKEKHRPYYNRHPFCSFRDKK